MGAQAFIPLLPDLDAGEVANGLRQKVRSWLASNWWESRATAARSVLRADRSWSAEFSRQLATQGWLGLGLPAEYGGRAGTPGEQLVLSEELNYAGAPCNAHLVGTYMVAPAIAQFGTQTQKARYLPALIRGEASFCLGYSESEAGSDLAALRTTATRQNDSWLIHGQKLWTTGADKADFVWLAARTDPQANPRSAGISVFVAPMASKGISIRESMNLNGTRFFTVTYQDVQIPLDALVGAPGSGWKVIGHALAAERAVFGGTVGRARRLYDDVVRLLTRPRVSGPVTAIDSDTRRQLGLIAGDIEVARQLAWETVRVQRNGGSPLVAAAMSKVFTSELLQRVSTNVISTFGLKALLSIEDPGAIAGAGGDDLLRQAVMFAIAGGTNDIQRNIIASRGLGLPKH